MATPVTATTRNQHTYDTRTVHVNNLRYAHIDNCWDNPPKDPGFPEQNTTKLLEPRRIQPPRQTKMLTGIVKGQDNDASSDSDEEGMEQILAETDQQEMDHTRQTGNQNIIDQHRPDSPAAQTRRYNLRPRPGKMVDAPAQDNQPAEATPDVERTAPLAEPLDHVVDERGTGLYPRERSDSNSTIVYDPIAPIDGIPGSVVRMKRDRQDSDEDLDANPRKSYHISDYGTTEE